MILAFILSLCLHIDQIAAIPTLAYPFNSQVPPVARVGQQYNYTLASNTFDNFRSDVKYTLTGQPAWLSLDSASRTFAGTPSSADVGSASFNIVATDSTGSTANPAVLVISSRAAPYVAHSLESQLQKTGATDGTGALILTQNTGFSLQFSPDTFAETGGNLSAYYGTSDNFTPLPSWITFDAAGIRFTGTAPPVVSAIAPPQYFEFVLVGTDYPGFAGISATFRLVIGAHELRVSPSLVSLQATVGSAFQYKVPINDVTLDGSTISSSNLSSVTANTTGSWLSFDASSYVLSGTPSATDASKTSVQVLFTDVFSDLAALEVQVSLNSTSTTTTTTTNTTSMNNATVFTGALPLNFNATPGTFFTYTFNSSVVPSSATLNITITGVSWLHYNPANRTLYGEVPAASSKRKRQSNAGTVTVTATDGSGSQTQTVGVTIGSASTTTATTTTSSTSTSHTTTPTHSPTSSVAAAAAHSAKHGLSEAQKLGIGLGIGIPILLALLALFAFCCLRKRRARSLRSVSSSNISRPVEREKDAWPQPAAVSAYDEPRQLGAFEMFKSNSSGRLSGYAMEVNTSGILEPPLVPLAHELPPLPESPGFEAVRSAYGSDESNTGTRSTLNSFSSNARTGRTLSENHSVGNVQPQTQAPATIKQVYNARLSTLQQENIRDSTNTLDSVSTDELFSVRLIGNDAAQSSTAIAPPLARPVPAAIARIGTQHSAQTIGTYTSSEGDYIQRYGSQGESLSSGEHSRQHLSQLSRNDSNQPQPWRVMNSQDSYGSFGSYATTDSNISDEFSLDESHSGNSSSGSGRRRFTGGIVEESETEDGAVARPLARATTTTTTGRPDSEGVLLEAPLTPNWASTPMQSIARRPTLNERVASLGKGRLMESTARRPMSSASIGSPDISADTETSAEIAFV